MVYETGFFRRNTKQRDTIALSPLQRRRRRVTIFRQRARRVAERRCPPSWAGRERGWTCPIPVPWPASTTEHSLHRWLDCVRRVIPHCVLDVGGKPLRTSPSARSADHVQRVRSPSKALVRSCRSRACICGPSLVLDARAAGKTHSGMPSHASPMFALGIETALDVAVHRLHNADPGEHHQPATRCNKYQGFHRRLPFRRGESSAFGSSAAASSSVTMARRAVSALRSAGERSRPIGLLVREAEAGSIV